MKRSLFVLGGLLVTQLAFGAPGRSTASSSAVARAESGGGGGHATRLGVGFSTWGGGAMGGAPALSALILLGNGKMSIQPLFSIQSSDPFDFAMGGAFRYTVHGGEWAGFHIGGAMTFGTANQAVTTTVLGVPTTTVKDEFFLNIAPLAGFHFGVLNNIHLSFDGGLNFHVTPNFQMQATPYSAQLGANLHYMF